MCLAVPMKVLEVTETAVRCAALGSERTAGLLFVADDPPAVGDYVVISLGQVSRTVSREEAEEAWALFGEILEATGA